MRVAVLWARLSGYLNACLKELESRPGVSLFVAHEVAHRDAPFEDGPFDWLTSRVEYDDKPDRGSLLQLTREFAPDVVLVSSWNVAEFRYVLRHLRPRPLRVLCMDNQWHGTLKQYLGVIGSPLFTRRLYDVAFVPGERQASFARRLGFSEQRIWEGLLCSAEDAATNARDPTAPRPHVFGYLGRLSPEKGIQDLVQAYVAYRRTTNEPWALDVVGDGPLASVLGAHEGVTMRGFLQPDQVSGWLGSLGCLVVPSRFEAWGVALSEGAAAGLPVIATDACGATPHLVHDFANGRIAAAGDVNSLTRCLLAIEILSEAERAAMGQVSRGLASPYTPIRWADTVLIRSSELLET